MAIFRGGIKIFGSDIRIGLSRNDLNGAFNNILRDPRFQDPEGGQVVVNGDGKPINPFLKTTKPGLINQMLQYIAQGEGLARSNRYYASFQLPKGSILGTHGLQKQDGPPTEETNALEKVGFATQAVTQRIQNSYGPRVNAFCKNITMPDRTMTTESVINGPGAPYHIVTDHTYSDVTATFYADKYLRERQYFELWQKSAFNDRTNNYELYENYTSDIDIFNLGQFAESDGTQEDPNARDDVTHGVKLYDCYPTSIGAPQLAYEATGVVEFTVTFKYRHWMNYFINKTADVALGDGGFDGRSIADDTRGGHKRLKGMGGLFGGLLSVLPPELRRAGRGVLGDLKRRIPIGDLTGGRVFPPFF